MKKMQGIYDDNQQLKMLTTLTHHNPMMGAIFYVGVTTGLRISDILALRVCDVGPVMTVVESKTRKTRTITLPPQGWEFLQAYINYRQLSGEDRIFLTTRQTVYNYFKRASDDLGLDDIAPHSMRHTYGWNVFRTTKSLDTTRRAMNHKFISTTVGYLVGGIMWLLSKMFQSAASLPPALPPDDAVGRKTAAKL